MSWIGVVTDAGNDLLAQWALGGRTLHISGATVGSGTHEAVNLRRATALAEHKDNAQIVSSRRVAAGQTQIRVRVGAISDGASYTAKEIGIWGHLDDEATETLLMIHQEATGIVVPTATEIPGFFFDLYSNLLTSGDGQIEAHISLEAYVSQTDYDAGMASKADKSAAVSSIVRNGTTFTATRANGTTFTFDQQELPQNVYHGEVLRDIHGSDPYRYAGIVYEWEHNNAVPSQVPGNAVFVIKLAGISSYSGTIASTTMSLGRRYSGNETVLILPVDDDSNWGIGEYATFRIANGSFVRVEDYNETFYADVLGYVAHQEAIIEKHLAVSVENDTHNGIQKDQYVRVRNCNGVANGYYQASKDIPSGGALSGLTYPGDGILNDLKSQIDTLNGNLGSFSIYSGGFSTQSPGKIHDIITNLPSGNGRYIIVAFYFGYSFENSASFYFIQRGDTWYGLQEIAKGSAGRTVTISADGTVTKGENNSYAVRLVAIKLFD